MASVSAPCSFHLTLSSSILPRYRFRTSPIPPFHVQKSSLTIRSFSSSLLSSKGAALEKPSIPPKIGSWQWKFQGNSVNIYYEEQEGESAKTRKNILMIPTISDVSTVEEWQLIAQDIVAREGGVNWRATIVDWPGLGYSDRPSINYDADVMEKFLVEFINASDGPMSNAGSDFVVFGGGHAATIAVRATNKGLLKPSAIAAIAPTWAGPLPIVFGRNSDMELRYGLLRGTLRAPALGWMMYNVLVSNEKAIQSQYKSHVYAEPQNVTPSIVESRYALTKRKGARYAPAAFLTGLLDPVWTREEFLDLFGGLDGKVPVLVVSTANSPKRSKAEMEALEGAKGVSKFIELPGALLPHEEYPAIVAEELYKRLKSTNPSEKVEGRMNNSSLQACISSLKACKTLTSLHQIHAFALKTSLDNHPHIVGQLLLLSTAAIPDAMDYACRLFTHVHAPDAFMYNNLIRGLSDSESPHQAFLVYAQMRRRSVPPDSFSFAFVLKAASSFRSLCAGIHFHCQALALGFDTHLFVGTTLVSMYAECGQMDSAQRAFDEMPQPNIVAWNAIVTGCFRCEDALRAKLMFDRMPWRNLTTWNVMLAGYMKVGDMECARRTFGEMPQKDQVSWSTMIVGFAQNGCFDDAFGLFQEMQRFGRSPSETTLMGFLSACAQSGAFKYAEILHAYVEKTGFTCVVEVSNALIDAYAKCGYISMARLVFQLMMEKKTVISWTSMIVGLAMYGYGKEAIDLFHEMEFSGMRPDGVAFISILYACSHAGLIEEGSEYFHKMEPVYGVKPSLQHYGCMVDLYGRAGLLHRAYEFVTRMPIEPNAVIWRTLLGACSIHGNVELAESVKEKLLELDPGNASDHVLLSNIYAVAGKWKDVASVRRLMTDGKLKKEPGWSMIEVDKELYRFVVGDGGNRATEEALEKLGEIMPRLKLEGYVPQTRSVLHDIEEEDKGDAVSRHSEKLAVAFGMARLCEGSIVRVVKNLRICVDCHLVMKLISKVYKREIVIRDRSRFHSFKDGTCNCRDYW
ncbi:hypothetical protein ACLOJK_022454 [Asimina triloba]